MRVMARSLVVGALLAACGEDLPSNDADSFGTVSAPSTTATTDASTGAETTSSGSDATSESSSAVATTIDPDSSTDPTDDPSTTTTAGEPFMMFDSLREGGTMGTALGGTFGVDGWTVTGVADRIYWPLPRLVEGSVEFMVSGITHANLPLADHEIFALYEGGHGIQHPIGYNPEYRVNNYKTMIRIYGTQEVDRVGQQKIMWGMCPSGAPGYNDGACACATSFFEEPFGGDGAWDGSPQRLRVEWGGGFTRYFRNDVEVLVIDWSASGTTFGPEALYVSIGTPRPEEVDSASMPIGAVFYDLSVEGVTGPAATCG